MHNHTGSYVLVAVVPSGPKNHRLILSQLSFSSAKLEEKFIKHYEVLIIS